MAASSSVAEKLRKSLSPDKDRAPRAASSKEFPTGSQRRNSGGGSSGASGSRAAPAAEEPEEPPPRCRHDSCVGGVLNIGIPPSASSDGAKKKRGWGVAGAALLGPVKVSEDKTEVAMKDTLTFDALFKRYELAKAFSLDSSQVRRDAKRIKKRLHDSNRLLLDPDGRMMQLWDLLTIISLLFTLLLTPFEIGFLDEFDGPGSGVLLSMNLSVTGIFATDMFFNFFRPYRDALSQRVKNHRLIAINYFKSWFFIDIISTVPIDYIVEAMAAGGGSHLKMVRLLRLLKLFRIMRASRVFARWADRIEHYISISHSSRTLLWWTFMLLTVVHWFCCVWGLAAQLQGSQRTPELTSAVGLDEWCATSGACHPDDDVETAPQCLHPCLTPCELRVLAELHGWSAELTFNQETWVCRAEAAGTVYPGYAQNKTYMGGYERAARYMSIAPIFGQVRASNIVEYSIAYVLAFCWLMMQNAFIGILCGTIADGDRHTKEYKQRMDELNYFLRDMHAPRELAVRAREHCRSTRSLFKKYEYQKLFEIMSPMLRGDLAQQMSFRTLENVWYFRTCEPELLRALSERLYPLGFSRAEKVYYEERINIIAKGAAARGGRILSLDQFWGDDMIITSTALKDTRYASALTYLEITTVSRANLEEVLVNYPKSERIIRVTALKMAMQRAGQIISHHVQTRSRAKQLSSTLSKFAPNNALFQNHASSAGDGEAVLREMMTLVNGGKKLRRFDDGVGQIVDENENVVDADFVRAAQSAHRVSTDEHLVRIEEELADMRVEQTRQLQRERQQMAEERQAIAEEREAFRRLVGKRLDELQGGSATSASAALSAYAKPDAKPSRSRAATPPPAEQISPTGTLTPPGERGRSLERRPSGRPNSHSASALARAGREAAGVAMVKACSKVEQAAPTLKMQQGVLMEKRYRRRKKGEQPSKSPAKGGRDSSSPNLNC